LLRIVRQPEVDTADDELQETRILKAQMLFSIASAIPDADTLRPIRIKSCAPTFLQPA